MIESKKKSESEEKENEKMNQMLSVGKDSKKGKVKINPYLPLPFQYLRRFHSLESSN